VSAERYLETARKVLERIEKEELSHVKLAAEVIGQSILNGGTLYVFGTGHAAIMAQEVFYRAGGLMLVNPIFGPGLTLEVKPATLGSAIERLPGYGKALVEASPMKKGDVLIVASPAGRNALPVEVAMEAKNRGVYIIALTSREWASRVESRHPSGKKLIDVADLIINDGTPVGDAALELEGFKFKVGPVSTIAGVTLMNMIIAETDVWLINHGMEPPVFVSANIDGGDEINRRNLKKYAERIHYMN